MAKKITNIKVVNSWGDLTAKQKELYRKLETDYRKLGLLYIMTFDEFINHEIYGALKNKKSIKDLTVIKNFEKNVYR